MELLVVIGMAGVAAVIAAYALLAAGRMAADSLRYQLMNVIGTAGILISLVGQWNLPAFVANAAWLVIGIVALMKRQKKERV